MAHIVVDARGLSCPQPVIMTQRAIEGGEFPFEVLVDTVTARENVFRMVKQLGFNVQINGEGDEYRLTVSKK